MPHPADRRQEERPNPRNVRDCPRCREAFRLHLQSALTAADQPQAAAELRAAATIADGLCAHTLTQGGC